MAVEYDLVRAKRKTISIRITRELRVEVRAPQRMPKSAIDRFVAQHEQWAAGHLARLSRQAEAQDAFAYRDGETLLYRGRELSLTEGALPVRAERDSLLVPAANREEAVRRFFQAETGRLVRSRMEFLVPLMRVEPTSVKVTWAVSRWGSCSGKNGLCFSYRLACLPDRLIDYIVVHELAHIVEHNHSPRFWAVVEAVLPDWRERRGALRGYHERILI